MIIYQFSHYYFFEICVWGNLGSNSTRLVRKQLLLPKNLGRRRKNGQAEYKIDTKLHIFEATISLKGFWIFVGINDSHSSGGLLTCVGPTHSSHYVRNVGWPLVLLRFSPDSTQWPVAAARAPYLLSSSNDERRNMSPRRECKPAEPLDDEFAIFCIRVILALMHFAYFAIFFYK